LRSTHVVNAFFDFFVKELPTEYAVELNALITPRIGTCAKPVLKLLNDPIHQLFF